MTIRAVIAEFNPFHNGHLRLVEKMRENGAAVVAVMSGSFVQRGSAAVYDKFTRARTAVRCGVDLVLELPVVYSLSSAQYFARGAVGTLDSLGMVDELWFGSESGDIEALRRAAEIVDSPSFAAELGGCAGMSYAAAVQAVAARSDEGCARLFDSPNNILAIEYLRAIKHINSSMSPVTVLRTNEHDSSPESAKSLRERLEAGESIARYVPLLPDKKPVFDKAFDKLVAARLITTSEEELAKVSGSDLQTAQRLIKTAGERSIRSIVASAHTKSLADSRLRRILFNLLLNNTLAYAEPEYLRPLAFNENGAHLLRLASKTARLPLASRGGALKNNEIFRMECRATELYNFVSDGSRREDFTYVPFCSAEEKEF